MFLATRLYLFVVLLVPKKQLGVVISCKMPTGKIRTLREYRDS
jgi:hypothetical protein